MAVIREFRSTRLSSGHESAKPKLAVIINSFNYESFVGRAIESVLAQKDPHTELFVVDDGSTDNSWEVINSYGVPCLQVENGGPRLACAKALKHIDADFVLFLDSDDELAPGSLSRIHESLDPSVSKIQFSLSQIDEHGNLQPSPRIQLSDDLDRQSIIAGILRSGVYLTPPTSGNVFRRDLCELLQEADYDFWVDGVMLWAAPFYGDVVSIAEPLGRYRLHGDNHSGFGGVPQEKVFKREMDSFVKRIEHLRTIVSEKTVSDENLASKLVDPRKSFYYREREFGRKLAAGERRRVIDLWPLFASMMRERLSLRQMAAFGVYFTTGTFVSKKKALSLLAFRCGSNNRSLTGFLKCIFGEADQTASIPA